MSKKHKKAEKPSNKPKTDVVPRPTAWIARQAKRVLSNLRFSLTLRIALHYCWQLLRTTFGMLLVVFAALLIAQRPTVERTMDALSELKPSDGAHYASEQLASLPVADAYLLQETYPEGVAGWGPRVALAVSDLGNPEGKRLLWYRNTAQGGLVAAFDVDQLFYTWTILMWTLLVLDLMRAVSFLRRQEHLNDTVLKPIKDITEAAETLSASNLSNRINIDGTKNELKDLATVINSMLDRIERSYNSQKQFVSDASHELRTPIAVIQGYASMLERWGKTDKEVLDEGIAAILQETNAMKELVERLLFLARHDKKTLMLEKEDFDPTEIMSAIHREAQMLSSTHQFELSPVQHCEINGDKSMLKQLMRILLDNAIKYTPEGGKITLGLRKEKNECVMSVADTGQGVSAEDLPRIFDRFYRSDKARKAQTGGHGLGLSIARIIVVAHGGKLTVRSKEGVGTTFLVRLPLSGVNSGTQARRSAKKSDETVDL